ncbi:MAG: hypothetical protein AAB403_20885, partial [Planctomycetota bacterium]
TVPISTLLLVAGVFGLVLAACVYVINLPYMILALGSPFFRERFYACLRLKSMPSALITQMDKNPQVASFCEEN